MERFLNGRLWALPALLAAMFASGCHPGPDCTPTQTDCTGACADLATDVANCGACGHSCAEGEKCEAGACKSPCMGTATLCHGVCIDTVSDPGNCGACGHACAE